MEQYISKYALVAEIERLKDKEVGIGLNAYEMGEENGKFEMCNKFLSFIDTMQEEPVSEDLENEIDNIREKYQGFESLCESDIMEICEHFFKFGAEWQRQRDNIPVSEDFEKVLEGKIREAQCWTYIEEEGCECPIYQEFGADDLEKFARCGADWQKQKIINKACDYLKDNIYRNLYCVNGEAGFPTAEFIKELRKYLEE